MKYLVDIKDASYATIEVEAGCKEQAESIAKDMYCKDHIDWLDCYVYYEAREKEVD